ncbi:MAG TPA: S9 family peptidase [Phenylobacterium sp.]|uniref:alpha/beta hydrolase family protein n=1 Tax=Phenylobacterium sp. TaxID=1871053 RepID=UPI002D59D5B9|nr:S9 family peptidase [Phenylobacterium sp.]HZZ66793.1 S9 family peptidase [Phenylobacterium sp.]
MELTRRVLLAASAAAPLAAPWRARAAAAGSPKATVLPPSLDELLAAPDALDADLSPNGQRLAILRQQGKDKTRAAFITLAKVDDLTATPAVVALGDKQVDAVKWANDERLLVWLTFWKDAKGHANGYFVGDYFIPSPVKRVLSIGVDGKDPIVLFGQNKAVTNADFDTSQVVDFLTDEPGHILMQIWDGRHNAYALHKVDVYTGASTPVEVGVPATDFWLTQRGVPVLRMDSNSRGTVGSVYGRAPGETDWKLIRQSRLDEMKKLPDFDIVGMTARAGVFLVATRAGGLDTRTIRTFDIATMQFGETVAAQAGHDMDGAFVDQDEKLVATAFYADRLDYSFVDPAFARHFKGVNTYFRNECNVEIVDVDLDHNRFVFKVSGPRDPGSYHIYHRDAARLEQVATCYPALTAERLAPMTAMQVKARDGAQIDAYLTRPAGAEPGRPTPLVVYPHGGPEIRDRLSFDPLIQAMAARGWSVVQPNFRGSGGYGKAFADQGRRHWGDKMQEDVEDAVTQLVAAGLADPAHMAICGASYGGYAALMGAVRQPNFYKAVVSIAGDCDLVESLAFAKREEGGDSPSYAYWLASMGDPKADQALLAAASPAKRAAEIRAPVLLIHGTRDTIVDPQQSKIMAKALKDAGKPFQYVELKGEGHRNWTTATWKTVIETSADFIARSL